MVFRNGVNLNGKVSVLQPCSLTATSISSVTNLVPALCCSYKKTLKKDVYRIADGYKNAVYAPCPIGLASGCKE